MTTGKGLDKAYDKAMAAAKGSTEVERRRHIAAAANELTVGLPAPRLSERSTRDGIIDWLQWNDPNGSHTDDLAVREGADPYTLDTAWDALDEMVKLNQ
jgi:hypothetical protein